VSISGFKWIVFLTELRCSCDRYRNSRPRMACEHLWGVQYFLDPPTPDELLIPEDLTEGPVKSADAKPDEALLSGVDIAVVLKGGYSKNSRAYERALQGEVPAVLTLILEVCKAYGGDSLWRPPTERRQGRHAYPVWLMIFANFIRVYNGFSLRKTQGFLALLAGVGYLDIDQVPKFATIGAFNRAPETSRLLDDLIFIAASPFRNVGRLRVAGDGTGWSSSKYGDHRAEHRDKKSEAREHEWYRATVVCDVDYFFVLSAFVSREKIGERKALSAMLPTLKSRGWDIGPFLLDAGFDGAHQRDELIHEGFDPFVPYKVSAVNAIPRKHKKTVRHPAELIRCFHLFSQHAKEFKEIFRFRVKVECLFSATKQICGSYVHGRCEVSARNDVLMMFLCHNIRMIHKARTAIEEHQRKLESMGTEPPKRRDTRQNGAIVNAAQLHLSL
jgi:hypothetical protein